MYYLWRQKQRYRRQCHYHEHWQDTSWAKSCPPLNHYIRTTTTRWDVEVTSPSFVTYDERDIFNRESEWQCGSMHRWPRRRKQKNWFKQRHIQVGIRKHNRQCCSSFKGRGGRAGYVKQTVAVAENPNMNRSAKTTAKATTTTPNGTLKIRSDRSVQ